MKALGMIEVYSFTTAVCVADLAAKTADVKIQSVERNRLGAGACVKMRGRISDVNAAMEAALAKAAPISKIISHTVIAAPDKGTELAAAMTINK